MFESKDDAAVITAVPLPVAVTKPLAFTVATFSFDEDQTTPLKSVSAGETVAVSCLVLVE